MRQVLRAGVVGRPRGMGWGGRWEGGSGWGTHVNPWLIHVNVWQKPLQYYKVISLQLIKINGKNKKKIQGTWVALSLLLRRQSGERQEDVPGALPELWTVLARWKRGQVSLWRGQREAAWGRHGLSGGWRKTTVCTRTSFLASRPGQESPGD